MIVLLKEAYYAIIIDVFACVIYFWVNLGVWGTVNNWTAGSVWSPLFVTSGMQPVMVQVRQSIVNYPFLLFFFIIAINMVLFVVLGREWTSSDDKKQ